MKKLICMLLILLVFLVGSENKTEGKRKPVLLTSQSCNLQIGVRRQANNKFHSASLEITYQDGKKFLIPSTLYSNGDWQYMYYSPSTTGEDKEDFFWECKIDDKVIKTGTFKSNNFLTQIPRDSYKKPTTEAKSDWECFSTFTVALSVWDKFKVLESYYKAVFIVTDPKGRKNRAIQYCSRGSDCEANFPTDFQTDFQSFGTYSWVCVINGQIVANNKFRYNPFSINTYSPF
ncbi:MAG: hypothetical protein HY819_02180 [Acidobacteria bacterium]|nr:hypothetical protein [Acidobacteriota bacterium]